MLIGLQLGCGIEAVNRSLKKNCHNFRIAELPPENPEEEKRIRFEIDFFNQMNEPKEKKSDLLAD